ncbi:MAG: hypothetical protein ACJAS1_003313, partial [Oleiphilaceae bacterium]
MHIELVRKIHNGKQLSLESWQGFNLTGKHYNL